MNNNNIWGPQAWTFLHTITFNYPEDPSKRDKQNYFNFFNSLKHVLPCEKCKKHYEENSTDLRNSLDTREDLVKWLIDIHNDVNKKNDKKIYTYSEVHNEYQQLYDQTNTINNMIIFVIIIIVFILVFFLYNIYAK